MIDDDYSELNDIEVGCGVELLEHDEEDNCFFCDVQKMTWYDIEELAENGDEQAIALIQARDKLRSYHYGCTNS